MLRTAVPLALLLLLAPRLAAPLAAEPSFDCHTAKTARELATCADARIATADRELAAAWQHAIAGLDPATAKALRADQKKFLENLDTGFEAVQWLDDPGQASSIALVPLRHEGQLAAFGLLVLASPDPTRYSADMGTDFLARIGEVASAALTRLLPGS